MDRRGPDAAISIRAARYAIIVFPLSLVLFGVVRTKLGLVGVPGILFVVVGAVAATVATHVAGLVSANAAGSVARAYTMPTGASTPYEDQFSYQESLAIRGDVAGALASYEAVIAERPGAATPRLKAADLYARSGTNAVRAAALFREVRDLPGASGRDRLYAASRLIDLYDGVLGEPGRALVELRRLIELHPDTDVARGARQAIARIKAQRAAEQGD